MPTDYIRCTSPHKLHNRPACFGDARRAFRRGYITTQMPVARIRTVASKYTTISEISEGMRAVYLDVRDPWSLRMHQCLMTSLLAEWVQVEVIPCVYHPGAADGTPYVWVYLGFAPDRDHPDERGLGQGCGPDPLSALLRALNDLPECKDLAQERTKDVDR